MINITTPTTIFPPTTKSANAVITLPLKLAPSVRIALVVDTFRASLKAVITRSTEGNTLKSLALFILSTISNINNDTIIFTISKKSNTKEGNGITSIIITITAPTANIISLCLLILAGSFIESNLDLAPFIVATFYSSYIALAIFSLRILYTSPSILETT